MSEGAASFLTELRRRRVGRVAVIYVVAGWIAIQVAATLFPLLNLPERFGTIVAIVVLCGFPVAIALAWIYDLKDGSIAKTTASSGKVRLLGVLALVMATAVAIAASYRIYQKAAGSSDAIRSIAVLPFADLSAKGDQAYFGDGIAEELLNQLANIEGLNVAARTSAFAFKGKNENIASIARQLGVRMVVEGSVRRDGDNLRIAAQLIDSKTGFHRWSETYDRAATSIFEVQSEIASAIADALEVELASAAPPVRATSTAAVESHDLYLLALSRWHARTPTSLREALRYLDRAIQLDPRNAQAHSLVGATWTVLPLYDFSLSLADAAAKSRAAAKRAAELDPNNAEVHAVLSHTALYLDWNAQESEREARRAVEMRPSYATAHQFLAEALKAQRRHEEALVAIDRALELDPLAPAAHNVRALILLGMGRTDEAVAVLRSAMRNYPEFPLPSFVLVHALALNHRYAEAAQFADSVIIFDAKTRAFVKKVLQGAQHTVTGDTTHAEYRAALRMLEQSAPTVQPARTAILYIYLQRNALAGEYFERAFYERKDVNVANTISLLTELTREPRLERIWRAMVEGRRTLD